MRKKGKGGGVKEIPLTQGYFTIIDNEDYERVMQHKWCVKISLNTQYAVWHHRINGRKVTVRLHRFILGDIPKMKEIDHINGDGLDNRKNNLRVVTHQQNAFNMGKNVKGVYWDRTRNKWRAYIGINGKDILLGRFYNLQDAIEAREKAACKYFGEFDARKNERVNISYR